MTCLEYSYTDIQGIVMENNSKWLSIVLYQSFYAKVTATRYRRQATEAAFQSRYAYVKNVLWRKRIIIHVFSSGPYFLKSFLESID